MELGDQCLMLFGEEVGGVLGVNEEVEEVGDLLRSACDLVVCSVTCKAR